MNGVQFLNEPVQVTAHLSAGGLRPEVVLWRETSYAVVAVGREWSAEDGVHVLVEVTTGARIELAFGGNRWYIHRYWPVDGLA